MNDDGCLDRGLVLLGAAALASKGSRASAAKPEAAPSPAAGEEPRQARSR